MIREWLRGAWESTAAFVLRSAVARAIDPRPRVQDDVAPTVEYVVQWTSSLGPAEARFSSQADALDHVEGLRERGARARGAISLLRETRRVQVAVLQSEARDPS